MILLHLLLSVFLRSLDTETTLASCKEMRRGPKPVPEKELILELLQHGLFATLVEASKIAGVSRQRVLQWTVDAGIDWREQRERYLQHIWKRELRRQKLLAKGQSPRRRTKAELVQISERAIREFNRKRLML